MCLYKPVKSDLQQKDTRLQRYGLYYSCKKFCNSVPKSLNYKSWGRNVGVSLQILDKDESDWQ